MKILPMYNASGAASCFCYRTKVIAVYPNSEVISTSIRVEWITKKFTKTKIETKYENS